MNTIKTAVLLAALSALFLGIGFGIGGLTGLIVAFGFAAAMNLFAYWSSDKLALRMAKAREVSPKDEPRLHSMVEQLASDAGIPKPRVYVVDSATPNAFATGRNPKHAAVAVTTGIMGILDERELRGVIGHELSHVRNRDILISAIVATFAAAISMLAWMALWFRGSRNAYTQIISLLAFFLAPMAAALIQMAISRTREYQADLSGARLTHDPEALASALLKLQRGVAARPMPATAVTESTAHMYIVNPLRGGNFANWFSTHPPVEDRVRRLREMTFRGF
jgi:heat shock protein HtpX